MPDLLALQEQLSAAILSGDFSGVAGHFAANGAAAGPRLNIYRNNTIISLTASLKAVFPVTVKLSDPRFFAYAAHEFITRHPPREARLSAYGAAFPRFLAQFEACRSFPIIAEMAALEWAISDSLNAGDAPPLALAQVSAALGSGADVRLALQPNLRFCISRWPLLGVWRDHQAQSVVIRGPLKPRMTRVAVTSHGEDIQCLELDAARFTFWRSLARGASLQSAGAKALRRDRLFDLVRESLLLFRSRLVTNAFTPCTKDRRP